MASEAIVSFVVGKLGDLLTEEARFLYQVDHQIDSIKRELQCMQCFLKDADAKQEEDKKVGNWVEQIRNLSHDAEDVIDIFILARKRRLGLGGVKSYIYIVTELPTRHKVGKKIQRITKAIEDITRSLKTYGIRDINDGGQGTSLNNPRRLFALNEVPDNVVGLQEIQKRMKKQLMNNEARRCVISIVGMGGSGKTTLAKKVYNDIKGSFDHHAFIYLSQQYSIKEVLTRIIKCVRSQLSWEEEEELQKEEEKSKEEDPGKRLANLLSEKRYLVVIDDIWTIQAWDELKCSLPDDSNKSRVMLTTRNEDVALHADPSSPPHHIRMLNQEESWEMFLKKIFSEGVICPPDLREIGREIVAKCDGLPLAIEVLGRLLSRKEKTVDAWSKVLASVHWHLAQGQDQCMKILALSYYDLPHYLKPCFWYLSLFPEDSEIRSSELIRLWVAEGFIEKRDNELIEDVAEDYLEELIGRSMIQVARERSNGFASRCRIHDLLRDLSISKAKEANFFVTDGDNGTTSPSPSVRRLVLYGENETTNQSTTALRSMLYFSKSKTNFSKLLNRGNNLLRVLHVDIDDASHEKSLPKEIGEEELYLRYFRFSGIQSLPSSIGNLSDLQTIILTESRYAGILPNTIWDLEKLRHLYAYRWKIDGHPRLRKLINLQTLCLRAGSWIEDGLDKLTNLRKLGILGSLSSYQNALSNAIEKLCNLQSLKLSYSVSIPPFMSFARHKFLYKMYLDGRIENLPEMPPNLAKLTLYGSQLPQDAIQTLEKLEKLRTIRLYEDSCCNEKIICSSGGFPQLESLELDCADPKDWVLEEGAMKSLERVKLGKRTDLKTVPKQLRRLWKQEAKWSKMYYGEDQEAF